MDIQFGKIFDKKLESDSKKKFAASMPPGIGVKMIGDSLKEWKLNEILGDEKNQQLFGELLNSIYVANPDRAEELVQLAQAGQLDRPGTTDRNDFNSALDEFAVRMAMVKEIQARLDTKALTYLAQPGTDLATVLAGADLAEVTKLLKDKAGFAVMDRNSSWPEDFLKGLDSVKRLEDDPSVVRIKQRGERLCRKYGVTMDEFTDRFDPNDITGSTRKLQQLTRSKLKGWKLASDNYLGHSAASADALIRYGEGTLGMFRLTGVSKIHDIYGKVFKDVGSLLATTIQGSPHMLAAIAEVAKTGSYEEPELEENPGNATDIETMSASFDDTHEATSFEQKILDPDFELGGRKWSSLGTNSERRAFIDEYCTDEVRSQRTATAADKKGFLSMWLSGLLKGSWNKVATDLKTKYP